MRCDLQIFSGCVCHLEQLHAQSPFLFPIVFSINNITSILFTLYFMYLPLLVFGIWSHGVIFLCPESSSYLFVENSLVSQLILYVSREEDQEEPKRAHIATAPWNNSTDRMSRTNAVTMKIVFEMWGGAPSHL